MADSLKQLGKVLHKNRRDTDHAIRRVSQDFPFVEKTRDSINPDRDFEMEFKTYIDKNNVFLDINFMTDVQTSLVPPVTPVPPVPTDCEQGISFNTTVVSGWADPVFGDWIPLIASDGSDQPTIGNSFVSGGAASFSFDDYPTEGFYPGTLKESFTLGGFDGDIIPNQYGYQYDPGNKIDISCNSLNSFSATINFGDLGFNSGTSIDTTSYTGTYHYGYEYGYVEFHFESTADPYNSPSFSGTSFMVTALYVSIINDQPANDGVLNGTNGAFGLMGGSIGVFGTSAHGFTETGGPILVLEDGGGGCTVELRVRFFTDEVWAKIWRPAVSAEPDWDVFLDLNRPIISAFKISGRAIGLGGPPFGISISNASLDLDGCIECTPVTTAVFGQPFGPTVVATGDGSTTIFKTPTGYVSGSLIVTVDSLLQDVTEISTTQGLFQLSFAPLASEVVEVQYVVLQVQGPPPTTSPGGTTGLPNPPPPDTSLGDLQPLIDGTTTGGTLDLAAATYSGPAVVDRAMTITNGVVLGTSNGTAIKVAANNVTLDNLHIIGDQYLTYNGSEIGISLDSTATTPYDNIDITDCEIEQFGGCGIQLNRITDINIDGNFIHDIVYAGVLITSGDTGLITGNTVSGIGVYGFEANENNAYGIALSAYVTGNLSFNPMSANFTIDGNTIDTIPTWEGIDTHGARDIDITNNDIWRTSRGIRIVDAGPNRATNTLISQNRLHSPFPVTFNLEAITTYKTDNTSITNNEITGWGANTIEDYGNLSTGLVIAGNIITP